MTSRLSSDHLHLHAAPLLIASTLRATIVLDYVKMYVCVVRVCLVAYTRLFKSLCLWFIPGIRFSPFDVLFIGKGGKRPLVAMVTKGEVSGGGVGGRVGAESCPFVKYQNALLLETVF